MIVDYLSSSSDSAGDKAFGTYLVEQYNEFLVQQMSSADEVMVCMANFIHLAQCFCLLQKAIKCSNMIVIEYIMST